MKDDVEHPPATLIMRRPMMISIIYLCINSVVLPSRHVLLCVQGYMYGCYLSSGYMHALVECNFIYGHVYLCTYPIQDMLCIALFILQLALFILQFI